LVETLHATSLPNPPAFQAPSLDREAIKSNLFSKIYSKFHPRSTIYNLRSNFLFKYLAIFSLFVIGTSLGFTLYRQAFNQSKKDLAYSTAASPVMAGRFLSFQGRLTDSSGNPIVSSTGIVFKLFNVGSTGVGTSLYTSESGNSQTVVPDTNGIFSVTIGKSHGTTIPATVFSENAEAWLEITAGSEVMNPRQHIATVAYAINAETLQGLPPSASGLKDTVLVIDALGNINLGETSPTIKSTSGTFGIEGEALLLTATNSLATANIKIDPVNSNGAIQLNTTGNGSSNAIVATNSNLSTGNLFYGQIGNDNRDYNFIDFQNFDAGTSSYSSRFSVDAYGNTFVGSTLSTTNLAVGSSYLVSNLNADLLDGYHSTDFVGVGTTGTFLYTAGNGLYLDSNQFKLGGALTEATRLNIGSTEVMYFSTTGNIGIGTTNPLDLLHLTKNASSGFGIRIDNSHSSISSGDILGYLDFRSSADHAGQKALIEAIAEGEFTGSNSYTGLAFFTNKTDGSLSEKMRINYDGYVGIGTTLPTYKLDVNGNARIGTTLTVSNIAGIGSTALVTNLNADVLDGYHASAFVQVGSTGSYIYTASNGITLASNNFKLGGAITENTRLNIGSTEVLYIDYATGRIGIGTTAPTYPFEIKSSYSGGLISGVTNLSSDTSSSARFQLLNDRNSTSLNQAYFGLYSSGNTQSLFGVTAADLAGIATYGTNNQGLAIGTINNKPVYFGQNNTLVMTINTGSVGIGTTNPSSLVTLKPATNVPQLRLLQNNGDFGFTLFEDSATGDLTFSRWASSVDSEKMRITNNGLVGIGTSTPTYKLQVAGSLLATTIGAGATDPNYALYTNGKFGVGSTAYFASYVGIGTTNPSSKLNIVGANSTSALLTIEDNSYAAVVNSLYLKNINTADNNGNAIYMGYGGTMGGYGVRILQRGYPASTLSSDLLFQIHNSTAGNTDSSWDTPLFIQRITGNVGIGTTNPLSTLNIVSAEIGTGSNKGFRIDNYNLTKSYSLRTGISGSENTSFSIYDETASANRLTISTDGNINILKNITIGGTFVSVGSTNLVTNLNADVLDGYHASAFVQVGSTGY
jgi:hypothetical protein